MERRRLLQLALTVPLAGAGALLFPADSGAQSKSRPSARPRMVVVDPGHGGIDPGAVGARGTLEKDITLHIAQELARLLTRQHGLGVRLTRDGDRFLSLGERVDAAREARADLFVSIHADSAPNREARGLSAYTLSEKSSDSFAAALARKENAVDRLGGPDLKDAKKAVKEILLDLTARHTRHAALVARHSIVKGAGKDMLLLDNPMRSANFAVLKAPDVPSVLLETGFLSNPKDEALLRDPKARQKIARVLAREIAGLVTRAPFA